MARGTSIQKPTTLLTIKKSMANAAVSGSQRSKIILITSNGIITGDMRVATGNLPSTPPTPQTDQSIPFYPVGSIIYFAGPNPPDGFLPCNGQPYETKDYPELANYLRGIPTYSSAYNNVHPYVSAGVEYFNTPDFTNPGGAGGMFIRNLNVAGLGGNTALPDTYQTEAEVDDRGTYSAAVSLVNRTFGSIQQEEYEWHDHQFANTNVGETGEDHFHHYFGAPGATNGHQLGYTYKTSSSNSYTNYQLFSMYDEVTTDVNSDGVDFDNTNMIGTHIHAGYLGFGPSLASNSHLTIHNSDVNYNNSSETRPKNYSLLFCIKY